MKIVVFGASGSAGSCIVNEALARGHEVTAVTRRGLDGSDKRSGLLEARGDSTRLEDVLRLSAGHDLIVSATRPAAGSEPELVDSARALLAGAAATGIRLLLMGGAATLAIPGHPGRTVMDDSRYFPEAARAIGQACAEQLNVCLAAGDANWTYMSPPALIVPGERTGQYRLGLNELVVDEQGASVVSFEDFAVALLDEAEVPGHGLQRFTVAY